MNYLCSRLVRTISIASLGLSVTYANAATVDCNNTPHWDSSATYTSGKQAQLNNNVYRAKWWTRNTNPESNSGPWQVWEDKGECQVDNLPPQVTLTSPANGTNFVIGDSVWLSADASDSDGQIAHVEFFVNGLPIGIATEAPYQVYWQADLDAHDVVAIAVDNDQADAQSALHNIDVNYPRTTLLEIQSSSMGVQLLDMHELATNVWQQTAYLTPRDSQLQFLLGNDPAPIFYGDIENDSIADLDGPAIAVDGFSGDYRITLNENNFSYSIERQFEQPLPFERNLERLSLNAWGDYFSVHPEFQLVNDHTWEVEVDLQSNVELVFEVAGIPTPLVFGDIENDRIAEEFGAPIPFSGISGHYLIRFNDQTMGYSIEQKFTNELPYARNFEAARAHIWSPNSGMPQDLMLVDDHTWEARFALQDPEAELIIEQLGTDPSMPLATFGEDNNDGIADENGLPIRHNAVRGDYVLSFNDQTLEYSIRRDFATQLPYARNFEAARAHIWSPSSGMPQDLMLVDDHTWEARFALQDPEAELIIEQLGADPMYPLADFGDNENDGIAEESASPIRHNAVRGDYVLSFNDQTLEYSIRRDFVTQLPYVRNFEAARAHIWSPSSGMPQDLMLVDDHTWEARFALQDPEAELIIEQLGTDLSMPLATFGEDNNDGIADENGLPIRHNAVRGDYVLRFNDQTLGYTIEQFFVTQQPYARNMEAVQTYIFGKELLDLTLVADHSWEVQFLKDDLDAMLSIWQIGSDPSLGRISEFGDFDNDNIADENAPEIRVNGEAGHYLLRFNDSNMQYEITPLL